LELAIARDMDDSLEQPSASVNPIESSDRLDEEGENSSGDEDGGLDWTKLSYVPCALLQTLHLIFDCIRSGVGRPVIPKRGGKDFEPSAGGESGLQLHFLDRARGAMFDALKATPSSSK
jgi:tRNA-splicing endonuclease subunit Sen54